MLYGLALGYDLPGRFRLRLEYNSFESETSDEYSVYWAFTERRWKRDFKLTVRPVILSLLYGLSPAYIGAGIGSFYSKYNSDREWEDYVLGFLVDAGSGSFSDSDSPTGFVLLGGFRFGNRPVFLNLEARYVVSTKAKLEDTPTEIDLSGLQLSLLLGIKV
jgi:hypothetical protein